MHEERVVRWVGNNYASFVAPNISIIVTIYAMYRPKTAMDRRKSAMDRCKSAMDHEKLRMDREELSMAQRNGKIYFHSTTMNQCNTTLNKQKI